MCFWVNQVYMVFSQSNIFINSPRWIFISSPVGFFVSLGGFLISPVENLLLGLTPGKFWKFGIFPGESRSPHQSTETGCLIGTAPVFKIAQLWICMHELCFLLLMALGLRAYFSIPIIYYGNHLEHYSIDVNCQACFFQIIFCQMLINKSLYMFQIGIHHVLWDGRNFFLVPN